MRVGHSGSLGARRLQGPPPAASPPSSRPARSRERGRGRWSRPFAVICDLPLAEPPARPNCACPPGHRTPGPATAVQGGCGPTINGESLGDLDFFWRSGLNRGNLGEDASARGVGRRPVWWGGARKTEGQRNRGIARRRARSGNCMERQRGTARGAAQAAGRPRHPRDARQPGDLPWRARRTRSGGRTRPPAPRAASTPTWPGFAGSSSPPGRPADRAGCWSPPGPDTSCTWCRASPTPWPSSSSWPGPGSCARTVTRSARSTRWRARSASGEASRSPGCLVRSPRPSGCGWPNCAPAPPRNGPMSCSRSAVTRRSCPT